MSLFINQFINKLFLSAYNQLNSVIIGINYYNKTITSNRCVDQFIINSNILETIKCLEGVKWLGAKLNMNSKRPNNRFVTIRFQNQLALAENL